MFLKCDLKTSIRAAKIKRPLRVTLHSRGVNLPLAGWPAGLLAGELAVAGCGWLAGELDWLSGWQAGLAGLAAGLAARDGERNFRLL